MLIKTRGIQIGLHTINKNNNKSRFIKCLTAHESALLFYYDFEFFTYATI